MRSRTLLLIGLGLGLVLALYGPAHTRTISREIQFERPTVEYGNGISRVMVEGLPVFAQPGEPLLPIYSLKVLLPQGEEVVSVDAYTQGEGEISLSARIECEQHQVPLSMRGPIERLLPDNEIYGSHEPFPTTRAVHVTTQTYRGYNIAFIRVFPVAYVGARRTIVYAQRIAVTVQTSPRSSSLRRSLGTLRDGNPFDAGRVSGMVDDAANVDSYRSRTFPKLGSGIVNPGDSYPYLIITNSTLEPVFQTLKAHKDARGLMTKIVLVSEISSNYTGLDLQDKIRNFLKDAYLNWETEFVLLGGDDEIIPHRGLYAEILPYVTDDDVASDLYYAALDGNWNEDADGLWGEPGEADLIPEVSLGRAPVGNLAEATNLVNKVIKYETAPVVSQIKNAQMTGELLYSEPTWGADSKEEIMGGTSVHGFTTVGIPLSWSFTTLFDRDLYPLEWGKFDVIANLNSGIHITNHLGHSINNYTMKMYNGDVDALFTNNGVSNTYFIAFIQGCFSAAFDNRHYDGTYVGDAIGEHFMFIENGAVAYFGTTRYGASAHECTRGAGHYYDRQFFDAIFGEGLTAIGRAYDDCKVDNVPFIDFRGIRWTHYALVLLGDPAMEVWTDTPADLAVTVPDVIYTSENEIGVTVTDGSLPVAGARVNVLTDSTYNCCGYTDGDGLARVDPGATAPGSLYVIVTANNFYPHADTVQVVMAQHPLVMLDGFTIDDDSSGSSSGNSDGLAEAGERIESVVSLRNIGQETASAVAGTLVTQDAYLTQIDSEGTFGSIPPGSTFTPSWAYVYEISPNAPDGHSARFELHLTYSDTSVVRHFDVLTHAPVLWVSDVSVEDTLHANSDGCIGPGETVEVGISLSNSGSGEAAEVQVTLSEDDDYAAVLAGDAYASSIPPGQEVGLMPSFVIEVSPECPKHHEIVLNLSILLGRGAKAEETASVFVGGSVEEDFEDGEGDWTHSEITEGFIDEWHLETYRNHTGGGAYSWKFGGTGGERYFHYSEGGLVTPEICLGSDATLTFWHYIRAELEGGNYASDGGIVEISVDNGATWTQLIPNGGYTHSIYPGTSTPIPAGTPCFAWTPDWTEVQFDLSSYQGSARIRFHFGAGEHFTSEEGWYIDDVVITDDRASVPIDERDPGPAPTSFRLAIAGSNPVVSSAGLSFDVASESRVRIAAYDVAGRLVERIVDSFYEPGRYSQEWHVQNGHPPGVYFIRMEAAGFSQTEKIVLLR